MDVNKTIQNMQSSIKHKYSITECNQMRTCQGRTIHYGSSINGWNSELLFDT